MNAIKSLITKFLGVAMIIGMAAGCASVTDATGDQDGPVIIEQPAPSTFGGGDEEEPIDTKPR